MGFIYIGSREVEDFYKSYWWLVLRWKDNVYFLIALWALSIFQPVPMCELLY